MLLSYPTHNKPNRVTLVDNGEAIYNITGKIKVREIQTFLAALMKELCVYNINS